MTATDRTEPGQVSATAVSPRFDRTAACSADPSIHTSASRRRARSRRNARSLWFTCASAGRFGPSRSSTADSPWPAATARNASASVPSRNVRVRRAMRRSWSRSSARTLNSGGPPAGKTPSSAVIRPLNSACPPQLTASGLPKSSSLRSSCRKPYPPLGSGPQLANRASNRAMPESSSAATSDTRRSLRSATARPPTRNSGRAATNMPAPSRPAPPATARPARRRSVRPGAGPAAGPRAGPAPAGPRPRRGAARAATRTR